MQTYYIAIPCVLLAVFLVVMWRDVRTLKSRVTDVVEQHNNVKKALDAHDALFQEYHRAPMSLSDMTFEPISIPETEQPDTPTMEPASAPAAKAVSTSKKASSKATPAREKDN